MTGLPSRRATARWEACQPATVLITGHGGAVLATLTTGPARLAGQRPGPLALSGTGWAAYPGSEWDEEPPGQWAVAVFPCPPVPGPAPRS